VSSRRLSQAISEGDGISVIVEVDGPEAARDAQAAGAEALVVSGGLESLGAIREATELPILCRYDGEDSAELEGADACVIELREGVASVGRTGLPLDEQFELVFRISKDDQLEDVFEELDPEIVVLAASAAGDETALDRVLELLPDVPAGKLAIADIGARTREEVEELERAGVDGVIVAAGNIAHLVGAAPPEV
jgi:NAD(P)H-dependent flavin oxidoreductase YrpB (nitropropane dioxygenase family)